MMDKKDSFTYTLENDVIFSPRKRSLITKSGIAIELSENSYRFLILLLNGETDKHKIINQVWAEQNGAVSESSYYGQLYLLRRSFIEAGLPDSLIKTIPRKGVKYMGNVVKTVPAKDDEDKHKHLKMSPLHDVKIIDDPSPSAQKKAAINASSIEWYHSKGWNVFISILTALTVCWLLFLTIAMFFF
ncbi:DNA-binding winged helix-turn-helix (wHTH) protein [Enterobacter asburiae]|uniref:winged helix-turn-helix domain-containing protein n=1 Tax=Enterobacter asburiae TaxID=61645 RepID=UPI00141BB529|nr:transcriptional regulator [Enterobacter asburiae]NIH92209.1 DNA-binding winged helix-turn-helix (wHTH) protein [Enterobacter asburiae]